MRNFAVAASDETIDRGNKLMELYAQNDEKKEHTLIRIFELAENELVRGTHPELEKSLRSIDGTISTLIKQINGIVAGQDEEIAEMKEKLNSAIKCKNEALLKAKQKEESATQKEEEAKQYVEAEIKRTTQEIEQMKKDLENSKQAEQITREICNEKTASNELLLKKMKEMEEDVELYKILKVQYSDLEKELNDLKMKLRENELQSQLQIEKICLQKERELRKEFETILHEKDIEIIRLKIEKENLEKKLM